MHQQMHHQMLQQMLATAATEIEATRETDIAVPLPAKIA